jgi:putative chitinase
MSRRKKPPLRYRLGYRAFGRLVKESGFSRSELIGLARDLAVAMVRNRITTTRRAIYFLSQVAHESGGFQFREEIADGSAYEGRRDLGNTYPGDGRRYKGRSFIMVTGRANYRDLPRWGGIDFESQPHRLSERRYAAMAAAHWWRVHGCNQLADAGDFLAVTRRINGGTNGHHRSPGGRLFYLDRARRPWNSRMLTPRRRRRPRA